MEFPRNRTLHVANRAFGEYACAWKVPLKKWAIESWSCFCFLIIKVLSYPCRICCRGLMGWGVGNFFPYCKIFWDFKNFPIQDQHWTKIPLFLGEIEMHTRMSNNLGHLLWMWENGKTKTSLRLPTAQDPCQLGYSSVSLVLTRNFILALSETFPNEISWQIWYVTMKSVSSDVCQKTLIFGELEDTIPRSLLLSVTDATYYRSSCCFLLCTTDLGVFGPVYMCC